MGILNHSNGYVASSHMVEVVEHPIFEPRKLRVICVGAGYSGLLIAYKYKYETNLSEYVDLQIYEKNHDVGGTWLENRYPGVACDIPAHVYTFPFAPNPNWSSFHAEGPEIWQYIRDTTTQYGLDEKIQFNSRIIETIWNDSIGKWDIKVEYNGDIVSDQADVLINGAGILNKWRWPDINGLFSFEGALVHTANWDRDLSWEGKRVALIGNGSSGVQILPEVQKTAAHLTTYIRTPTWISPPVGAELTKEGKNFQYTEEEKKEFRDDPEKLKALRKALDQSFNQMFPVLFSDGPHQAGAQQALRQHMSDQLGGDPELCEKLIPKFNVGCRRLTPGVGYLEAITQDNVNIEFGEIEEITKNGIRTVNGLNSFDIIICATGFDVSFTPFWKLIGKNGTNLADKWSKNPEGYLGICAPDMPNYFIFNGPNSPVGHGPLLPSLSCAADYILRWVRKIATQEIKSVTVSKDAVAEYNAYTQEFLKRMVWSSGCSSWYKNGKVNGPVTAMYAGSVLHYREMLEELRTEDFELEYRGKNRFRFMGNGLTARETRFHSSGEGDLAFYLEC